MIAATFVTKCKSTDAECIKANTAVGIPIFAAGIPELGVERLDPAWFDFVDSSKLNLNFILTNVTVMGLKKCRPLDAHREPSKSKLYVKLTCSTFCTGRYELTGRVLALDVEGRGAITVRLRRVEIFADMDLKEVYGADGKKHLNITNFKYTFELIEKSDVIFENLFQGNKALSQAASEVVLNSGNEIVREIGDPMFHASVTKVIKNFNIFFKAVPIEDLSLDN
ncbi:circadian clock-controlled protein daywake-like [Anticarsia gemmatalis]|uniref:circadian clock-controlled protein daywake-like n=1 Tax=Anticarsia gemmatalis TaxID=129554 RepID=UPI003F75D5CB